MYSDTLALDVKHRKAETAHEYRGLTVSIGKSIIGPRFYEIDEVFHRSSAHRFQDLTSYFVGGLTNKRSIKQPRVSTLLQAESPFRLFITLRSWTLENHYHTQTGWRGWKARSQFFSHIDRTGYGLSHEHRQIEHSSLPLRWLSRSL